MGIIAGWSAILLALFSLAPSVVPGAFSIIGLLISLIALIISVLSVTKAGKNYFRTVMAIIIVGIFMVNDGLRVWEPLELPINMKISLYAIFFFVVIVCAIIVNNIAKE